MIEKILGVIALSLGKKATVYAVGRVSTIYPYFKQSYDHCLPRFIVKRRVHLTLIDTLLNSPFDIFPVC